MARKTAEESEKTRQLLLDTAGEVFYKKGVSQTTLQDVAEAAGMSRGAIYWRFKDKAELFRAYVEDVFQSTDTALESIVADPKLDQLMKLREIMVTVFVLAAREPRIRRAYAVLNHRCEYTREFREEQPSFEMMEKEYVYVIESLVKEAQAEQLITNTLPAEIVAFSLSSFTEGVLNRWTYDEEGGIDLIKESERLVDSFLNGIKAHP